MKTYTVEFNVFNKVKWRFVDYNITALSKEQLKDTVLNILEQCFNSDIEINKNWLDIGKDIKEEELIFPIVVENIFY